MFAFVQHARLRARMPDRNVTRLMNLTQTLASSITELNQQAMALYSADQFAAALSTVMPVIERDESALDDATIHAIADALNQADTTTSRHSKPEDAERYWRRCLRMTPGYVEV